jgi:hypothetical protein
MEAENITNSHPFQQNSRFGLQKKSALKNIEEVESWMPPSRHRSTPIYGSLPTHWQDPKLSNRYATFNHYRL